MDYKIILNHILSYILTLYGNPKLPRKIVQDSMYFMDNFIKNVYLPSLKTDIIEIVIKANVDKNSIEKIKKCFNNHSSVFEAVSTEKKIFSILKDKGFIDHEEYEIGTTFVDKIVGNELKLVPDFLYGIHVPLRKTLKIFLELPGMFNQIQSYVEKLQKESHIITNIMQSDLWLNKYSKKIEGIVLPLYMFYDDLEVGNALGSHAGVNKCGAVYFSIACLPPHIASRLSSVLFTTLIHTEDKKKSSNKQVFRKVIEELNFLSSKGNTINIDGVP